MGKAKGIQREVRSYVGAGRFGKGGTDTVSMLGPRAIAKKREEAAGRRVQASQGASTHFTEETLLTTLSKALAMSYRVLYMTSLPITLQTTQDLATWTWISMG